MGARSDDALRKSRAVGIQVRRRRLELGLTQKAVEDKARADGHSLPQSVIARIESGEYRAGRLRIRSVSVDQLSWFAKALDISAEKLLTEPSCSVCLDSPPPGFTCNACSAGDH